MNLEDFVARGQAAQKAVDDLTQPKVDLVALLKECRMGLSVLLDHVPDYVDGEYDPSDQARELIGRLDRIMEELK